MDEELIESHPPDVDGFLWHWVAQANVNGVSTAIVLNIGGCVIVGQLTSAKDYFDSIAQEMSDNVVSDWQDVDEGEARSRLKSFVAGFAGESNSMDNVDAHYFVHLKNAVIHQGKFTFAAPYWRGRLSEVTGYMFGGASIP